jgi:WhiB family redox-sensing transcriptional regulator
MLNDGWREDAACKNSDLTEFGPGTDLFFPPRDKEMYNKIADRAREYCFETDDTPACPVRNKCLWYAVEFEQEHGIWGGLSHRERNARVRKWQRDFKHKMSLEEYILSLTEGKYGNGKVRTSTIPER